MDKFADSLMHLSKTFLTLEDYKGTFTKDEIEEMFLKITDKVCENCEKKEWCMGENRVHTYQMLYEILCAVEEYGAELNIELKRKLQKKCIMAPRFLRETLEVFENAKQILMWNNKIVQNREGYAYSPDTVWQREFEEQFEYTETDDQLRCIQEIKKDMESPVPMDRLLCGDVGYGKTEVAFRA